MFELAIDPENTTIFEFVENGGKTKLAFDQSGYPDDAESHIADGWHQMYWMPMNAHFEQT